MNCPFARPYYVFIAALLVIAAVAQAQVNPKAINEMTAVINLGGELSVSGNIQTANLSLHIPQEGIQNVVVSGVDRWDYRTDTFGNRLLLLSWNNPSGTINYNVKITVKNKAKHFPSLSDVGNDPQYLKETDTIVFNDDIRKMAFPYKKTWENIARLTVDVNKLIDYDINLVGQRKSSDWVLQNKRGVCVEHANLLTALLRVSGIPTRYVVGYAYSTLDNKLIGHTWVEVLDSQGKWIPFDPTWLEGGYIDATHIATAYLLDDNQVDTLNYFGNGDIKWQKSEENIEIATKNLTRDKIDIIDYKLANITTITTENNEFSQNAYGFVKARIENSECSIIDLTASSCIDEKGQKVFDIYDGSRQLWFCNSKDVYWFFDIKDSEHSSYICPVSLYDQVGSSESAQVTIRGRENPEEVVMSGPDRVGINEPFLLTGNGMIYSPEFGIINSDISIDKRGKYRFYLYSDGALAFKDVEVVEKKEFTLSVKAPTNTTFNSSFIVDATVRNLGNSKSAIIKLYFDDKTSQQSYNFALNEEKKFAFNVTASKTGMQKITAEVISDTLESYTTYIDVKELPKKEDAISGIINSLKAIINSVVSFLQRLFGQS